MSEKTQKPDPSVNMPAPEQNRMLEWIDLAYRREVVDQPWSEIAKETGRDVANVRKTWTRIAPWLEDISNQQIKIVYHRLIDGWRWGHVARECKVEKGQAQREFERVRQILAPDAGRGSFSSEYGDAEKVGQVIAMTAGRLESLRRVCEDAGLPVGATNNLVHALRSNYPSVFTSVAEVKTEDMIAMLDTGGRKALEALNLSDLTTCSPRDMAVIADIMIRNAQLLRGKATSILSHDDRRSLRDMMPELLAEANRRGLTIDNTTQQIIESDASVTG